jgi:carboxyl-terminal processing protease
MSSGDDDKKKNWWEAPLADATGDSATASEPGGTPTPGEFAATDTPEAAGASIPPPAPETPEATNAQVAAPPVWQPPQAGGGQPPPAGGWQPPQPAPSPVWPPQAPGWQPPHAPGWGPNAAPQPPVWPSQPPAPGWAPQQPAPGWPSQPAQGWQQPPVPGWSPQPQAGWQPGHPGWPSAQPLTGPGIRPVLRPRSAGLARILVVVALCLISFSGGMAFDHLAFPAGSTAVNPQSTTATTQTGQVQDSALYNQALSIVKNNFVGISGVTDQQLLYGAIKGMVDSLGDTGHSVFLTPQQYADFTSSLSAQIAGIGVVISDAGDQTITRVLSGTPADAGGIKVGDKITAIDATSTTGWTIDQLRTKIRGTAGTKLTLTVIHNGSVTPVDITLTRAAISVPLVAWGMVPGTHVADIALTEFSDGASAQLKTALAAATKAGATSIILDLRGNPGGYASEAQAVASEFLASGTVYLTEDAAGKQTQVKVDPNLTLKDQPPLVVLVDHDSASSAEIVAGALQDSGRAKILGVATFGTGTVLQKFTLSDGSAIYLGVEYWLTPSGHKIFGVGITPDEKVAMPANAFPTDPADLAAMSTTQFNALTDAELLAAVKDLNK